VGKRLHLLFALIKKPENVVGNYPEADERLKGEGAAHRHVRDRVSGQHPDARVQPADDPMEHDGPVQPRDPAVVPARAGPGVGYADHCEQGDVEAGLARFGKLGVERLCDHGP